MLAIVFAAAMAGTAPAGAIPVNVVTSATAPLIPVNVLSPIGVDPSRFVERPGPDAFATAYPHGAAAMAPQRSGDVASTARWRPTAVSTNVKVADEIPAGVGFGNAALGLARAFRLDPASEAAKLGTIDVPIGFATSSSDAELPVAVGPCWPRRPQGQVAAVYPDIGGGVAGQVVMRCALEPGGRPRRPASFSTSGPRTGSSTPQLSSSSASSACKSILGLSGQRPEPAYGDHDPGEAGRAVRRRKAASTSAESPARSGCMVDPLESRRSWTGAVSAPRRPPRASWCRAVGYADCTRGADGALAGLQPVWRRTSRSRLLRGRGQAAPRTLRMEPVDRRRRPAWRCRRAHPHPITQVAVRPRRWLQLATMRLSQAGARCAAQARPACAVPLDVVEAWRGLAAEVADVTPVPAAVLPLPR